MSTENSVLLSHHYQQLVLESTLVDSSQRSSTHELPSLSSPSSYYYYQRTFLSILNFLLTNYVTDNSMILDNEETCLIKCILSLTPQAQRIFIRLYLRQETKYLQLKANDDEEAKNLYEAKSDCEVGGTLQSQSQGSSLKEESAFKAYFVNIRTIWMRANRLLNLAHESDNVDLDTCIDELYRNSLVEILQRTLCNTTSPPNLIQSMVLDLLSNEELKSICKTLRLNERARGQTNHLRLCCLIAQAPDKIALNNLGRSEQGILEMKKITKVKWDVINLVSGPLIRIRRKHFASLFRMISILFFMNTSLTDSNTASTLNDAILNDLNKRKLPKYVCTDPRLIFPNRHSWTLYWEALEYERQVNKILTMDKEHHTEWESIKDKCFQLLSAELHSELQRDDGDGLDKKIINCDAPSTKNYFVKRFRAGWVYCRILASLATVLEQSALHSQAVSIYRQLLHQNVFCHGRRGQWWARLALDLHKHLQDPEEALSICKKGLKDAHVRNAARYALEHRLATLNALQARKQRSVESKRRKKGTLINDLAELEPSKAALYSENEQIQESDQMRTSHGHLTPPVVVIDPGELASIPASGSKIYFKSARPNKFLSVEEHALKYFIEHEGWNGLISESSIWTTMFACLFWDILFGAFEGFEEKLVDDLTFLDNQHHMVKDVEKSLCGIHLPCPFLTAPLDLFTDAFYVDRKEAIEVRLLTIAKDKAHSWIEQRIKYVFARHAGEMAVGCYWPSNQKDDLEHYQATLLDLVWHLGNKNLVMFLRHLAYDYRSSISGMPDLVLWKQCDDSNFVIDNPICDIKCSAQSITTERNSDCMSIVRLVEVKSVRDRLSDAQRSWWRVLQEARARGECSNLEMIICRIREHNKTNCSSLKKS